MTSGNNSFKTKATGGRQNTPIPCWSPVAFAGQAGQAPDILYIKEKKNQLHATEDKISHSQI